MGTGGAGQVKEVGRVAGEDVIAILSKADHRCIDYVRAAGSPEQQSCAPSEVIIDWDDFHACQEPGDRNLPAVAAAPDLGHNTAVGQRSAPMVALALDQRGNGLARRALRR